MHEFLATMWGGLGGDSGVLESVDFVGEGELPSVFAVSDFAAAAVAAAGVAVAECVGAQFGSVPRVTVNRRLASLWYGWSIRPEGWEMPGPWDPIAGDYRARDGWIRLHTNAPHHRDAALAVLGVSAEKELVARAVAEWNADELEAAVVERGGCAATMRSVEAWKQHPQGESVCGEPLVAIRRTDDEAPNLVAGATTSFAGAAMSSVAVATRAAGATASCAADATNSAAADSPTRDRPLRGLRVLDLTRVLAGPVATRFLAAFGADVLRIDPSNWDEAGVIPEVTLGKRCARLDLRIASERAKLQELLKNADVLVHGYRADALECLDLGAEVRRALRPSLIDVSLNAYGWTGPWRSRRGFDSLVQMSSGIADAGMKVLSKERPTPLPVQALDHATGYMLAAAALRGITHRHKTGRGFEARTSLARMADLLTSRPAQSRAGTLSAASDADYANGVEATAFGPARRLLGPVTVGDASMHWDRPATRLGSAPPEW